MKKIMILTSMRVGSTWLCYFFSHIFGELFQYTEKLNEVEPLWKKTPVVKAHRLKNDKDEVAFSKDTATTDVIERFPDSYIITAVRNPKGRISSQVHFRIPSSVRIERIIKQAIEWSDDEQFSRMLEGYSTRAPLEGREHKYIWTTYEWLLEDPYKEFGRILEFMGERHDEDHVRKAVDFVQFDQQRGGRIREGRLDSWQEEAFVDKLDVLDEDQKKYYDILERELTLDK